MENEKAQAVNLVKKKKRFSELNDLTPCSAHLKIIAVLGQRSRSHIAANFTGVSMVTEGGMRGKFH